MEKIDAHLREVLLTGMRLCNGTLVESSDSMMEFLIPNRRPEWHVFYHMVIGLYQDYDGAMHYSVCGPEFKISCGKL